MQSKWKWKWNVFRILFSVRKIWRASDVFSVFVYWMTICFVYLLWYWNCVSVLFQCLTHFFTNLYVYMYYVRLSISLTVWVIVCLCEKQIKNASFEYISSRTFWVWHNLYTLYTHRWIQLPQSRSTIQARILILLNTNLYTMLYVGHCLMGIILAGSRRGAGASIVR